MTNTERIQALMGFGYTEREAAFSCIAALHGGFFLRRQYSQFTGTAPGGADTVLIDKLLARGQSGNLSVRLPLPPGCGPTLWQMRPTTAARIFWF